MQMPVALHPSIVLQQADLQLNSIARRSRRCACFECNSGFSFLSWHKATLLAGVLLSAFRSLNFCVL